jgi:hypothetical protein
MDFLNHKEGTMVGFSFFLLYRNYKRLCEFEEIEISRQSCREVTVNNKEDSGGNSQDSCLDFVPEFGFCTFTLSV